MWHFKVPWVSRRDHDITVKIHDDLIDELLDKNWELTDRVAYLERERESLRLASLTPDPEPITILHPLPVDEDIARWEGEGGA